MHGKHFFCLQVFLRLVTYLLYSSNNRAFTVLQCFQETISTCSVLSRVHCDYGVENADGARFTLETRGTDRSSIITGSSVHNQRVEWLQRDVRRIVVWQYQNVFHYLETSDLLDPLNDLHLFCLHHVFINCALSGNTTVILLERNIAISQNNCSILRIFVVMWNPLTTHPPSIPLFMGWRKMDLSFGTRRVIKQ